MPRSRFWFPIMVDCCGGTRKPLHAGGWMGGESAVSKLRAGEEKVERCPKAVRCRGERAIFNIQRTQVPVAETMTSHSLDTTDR